MNAYLIAIGLVAGVFYGGVFHRVGVLGLLINTTSIIMIMGNQLDSEHVQTWVILGCVIGNRMELNSLSLMIFIFTWLRRLVQKGTQIMSEGLSSRIRTLNEQVPTKPQNTEKNPDHLWDELKRND